MTSARGFILLAIVIFFILLLLLLVIESRIIPALPVGPVCVNDFDCPANYECLNGLCKAPLGGVCNTLNDCVLNAVMCSNGICQGEPLGATGQACPCQSGLVCVNGFCRIPIGGTCGSDSDCVSGFCINGVCGATGSTGATGRTGECHPEECYDQYHDQCYISTDRTSTIRELTRTESSCYTSADYKPCYTNYDCSDGYYCSTTKVYRKVDDRLILVDLDYTDNAIDLTVYNDEIYILLEGGEIITTQAKRIEAPNYASSMCTFNGHLYCLAEGYLYVYKKRVWERVSSIPSELLYMATTLKGDHIWLAQADKTYTYDANWKLIKTKHTTATYRCFGSTLDVYVDISADLVKTSIGKTYSATAAVVLPSNQVEIFNSVSRAKLLYLQGSYHIFVITTRSCAKMV